MDCPGGLGVRGGHPASRREGGVCSTNGPLDSRGRKTPTGGGAYREGPPGGGGQNTLEGTMRGDKRVRGRRTAASVVVGGGCQGRGRDPPPLSSPPNPTARRREERGGVGGGPAGGRYGGTDSRGTGAARRTGGPTRRRGCTGSSCTPAAGATALLRGDRGDRSMGGGYDGWLHWRRI